MNERFRWMALVGVICVLAASVCYGQTPTARPVTDPDAPDTPSARPVGQPKPQAPEAKPVGQAETPAAPDIDTAWTHEEFEACNTYLDAIQPSEYPRLGDPLFDKIIRAVKMAVLMDPTIEIGDRMQTGGRMLIALADILNKYSDAYGPDVPLESEIAQLMAATLVVSGQVAELINEAVADLDPNDPDDAAAIADFDEAWQGMAQQMEGILTAVTITDAFSKDDRLGMAKSIAANGPVMVAGMSDADQAKILAQAQEVADAEADADIQAALVSFIAKSSPDQ